MLSLQMKSRDYVTIGNQVVVQVFKESGPQFRISIKAPREISIVRGKVLERDGEMRPEGLLDRGPKRSPSDQVRYARYLQKLEKRLEAYRDGQKLLSETLGRMDELLDGSRKSLKRKDLEDMREQIKRLACLWENVGGEMKGIGVEKANAEKADAGAGNAESA